MKAKKIEEEEEEEEDDDDDDEQKLYSLFLNFSTNKKDFSFCFHMYVCRKTFQLIRSIFTLDEGEAIHLQILLQLEGPFAGSNYNVRV